jgi:hypothetical protein
MPYEKDNFEQEYFDISEKILKLSDELAEDIILTNIKDQLESKLDLFTDKLNYVTLFREKYSYITPENTFYDKNYIRTALLKVTELVSKLLESKYGVKLGTDLDYVFPDEYLKDMETMYEFFFIRHFKNLVWYFNQQLQTRKADLIERYRELIQEDEHKDDIFVVQAKKKFRNFEDVIIIHFINDIIDDIREYSPSGYVLFDAIVNTDYYEEFNNRMGELLENYGNKVVFSGDREVFEIYMSVLDDQEVRNELRNEILMKYLETTEIDENA